MKKLLLSLVLLSSSLSLMTRELLNDDFIEAVRKKDVDSARRLLGEGADINKLFSSRFYETEPALAAAISTESPDMVRLLLDKGAEVALERGDKQNACDIVGRGLLDTQRVISIALMVSRACEVHYRRNAEYLATLITS